MRSTQLNRHAFDRPGAPVPAARRRSPVPWKRRRSSVIDAKGATLDSPTGVVPETSRPEHWYEFPTADAYLSVLSAADEPTKDPRSAIYDVSAASLPRSVRAAIPATPPTCWRCGDPRLIPTISRPIAVASLAEPRETCRIESIRLESGRPAARPPLWRRSPSRIPGPPGAAPSVSRRRGSRRACAIERRWLTVCHPNESGCGDRPCRSAAEGPSAGLPDPTDGKTKRLGSRSSTSTRSRFTERRLK